MLLITICQLIWHFLKHKFLKIIQSGGFLGSLLSKLAGPLMKVAILLAKNVLAPLGITDAASAIDAAIQNKNAWFWNNNFNNFKWKYEWYNKDYSSSWRF